MKEHRRTVGLLKQFTAKVACSYCNKAARLIFEKLRTCLTEEEIQKLGIAWGNFVTGKNSKEVNDICKQLIQKYSN